MDKIKIIPNTKERNDALEQISNHFYSEEAIKKVRRNAIKSLVIALIFIILLTLTIISIFTSEGLLILKIIGIVLLLLLSIGTSVIAIDGFKYKNPHKK